MKSVLVFLLLLPAVASAQPLLPDTVYAWQRLALQRVEPAAWDETAGARAELLRAYDVRELLEAVYVRGTQRVHVRVMTLSGRERAFGLFRAMADDDEVHGIVGDAFRFTARETLCAYGPFVVQLTVAGRRDPSPDEALLLAVKRALYRLADCYGTDIPMPVEERRLGSERYFVPSSAAWDSVQEAGFMPVRDLCETHAAWMARYEKPRLGVRRTLIRFPFRQPAAAAQFAERLRGRCADRGTETGTDCSVPGFRLEGTVLYVIPGRYHVLLVLGEEGDGGICAWLDSLRGI